MYRYYYRNSNYFKLKKQQQQICSALTVYQISMCSLCYVLTNLILKIIPWGECFYYLFLIDGKLRHREIQYLYERSHSKQQQILHLNLVCLPHCPSGKQLPRFTQGVAGNCCHPPAALWIPCCPAPTPITWGRPLGGSEGARLTWAGLGAVGSRSGPCLVQGTASPDDGQYHVFKLMGHH